jgi:beta-lactam-binding protein with PASTA domain
MNDLEIFPMEKTFVWNLLLNEVVPGCLFLLCFAVTGRLLAWLTRSPQRLKPSDARELSRKKAAMELADEMFKCAKSESDIRGE